MIEVREWTADDSVPELTALLNLAYRELFERGLNYTAATQDDAVTRERMAESISWAAWSGGQLVGYAAFHPDSGCPFYRQKGVRVIGPVAVHPDFRGRGIGKDLISKLEQVMRSEGLEVAALDTAEPALHLIMLYEHLGYRQVGKVNWLTKTYESVLMAKALAPEIPIVHAIQPDQAHEFADVVHRVFDEYEFTWEEGGYHADLYGLPGSYPDGFFVATLNGRVVGGGGIEIGPDRALKGTDCELVRLYVHPEFRRRGLANRIMAMILDVASERGCSKMEIWSDKRYQQAHALYKSWGAVEVADRICDDPDQSPEWGFILDIPQKSDGIESGTMCK